MASSRQIQANRVNALRSTGPRMSAGLARAAQNAVKVGLFSKLLTVAALGETVAELDQFRRAVVTDLNPTGAVETELADRVAGLLWRLRRVARAEAAAMATTVGDLPPHPDAVAPDYGDGIPRPEPPDAPTAYRLARTRGRLAAGDTCLARRRAEAAVLDADRNPDDPVSGREACQVLWAGADELGWPDTPDPWPPVLAAAGFEAGEIALMTWTMGSVLRVLRTVADRAGRDPAAFLDAARERLHTTVTEYERLTAEHRREEARLVDELLRERQTVAAARILADEGLVTRVARAEAALSRELARALALLADLQARRPGGAPAVGRGVAHGPMMLPPGASE